MGVSQRKRIAPYSAGAEGDADRRRLSELDAEYERFFAEHADRSIDIDGRAFHDAGHTALWRHANEYNEVIRAFLARPARGETAGSPAPAAANTVT